jgi:hypothetical protein
LHEDTGSELPDLRAWIAGAEEGHDEGCSSLIGPERVGGLEIVGGLRALGGRLFAPTDA